MKKIAIISLAIGPLLAGCASEMLGPKVSPRELRFDALADVNSQLKSLRWRVSRLSKKLAVQSRSELAQTASDPGFEKITQRLAELENASQGRPASSSSDGAREIAERIAELNQKFDQLVLAQKLTTGHQRELATSLENERSRGVFSLKKLEDRLNKLELAQSKKAPADKTDPAVGQQIELLTKSLKALTSQHNKLSDELEKDRALVVDYLEDLDNRLVKEPLIRSVGSCQLIA